MIFLTGDTHGSIDARRLTTGNWPEQKQLTQSDTLIILGDFGFIWDHSKEDTFWLNWLSDKPYTIVFVCGNHENFDLIETYPVKTWNGGRVHEIRPNVFHLMRGECFTIEDTTFFVLGGAHSHDKKYRKEGISWWPQEVPSAEELAHARDTLDALDWSVDVVLTHTPAPRIVQKLGFTPEFDDFSDFLGEMEVRLDFKQWYFGHFHQDRCLDSRHQVLYHSIQPYLPTP